MTERRFTLPPLGLFPRLVPIVVGGLVPLLLSTIVVLQAPPDDFPIVLVLFFCLALPVAGLAIAATLHGRTVELRGDRLRVRRWPAPRDFRLDQIDLERARVADFDGDPALKPTLKLMGSRMPGMRSGWFLTRGRQRAYVLATSSARGAVLPLRDGRLLLLGVDQPGALLQALRDAVRPRR